MPVPSQDASVLNTADNCVHHEVAVCWLLVIFTIEQSVLLDWTNLLIELNLLSSSYECELDKQVWKKPERVSITRTLACGQYIRPLQRKHVSEGEGENYSCHIVCVFSIKKC